MTPSKERNSDTIMVVYFLIIPYCSHNNDRQFRLDFGHTLKRKRKLRTEAKVLVKMVDVIAKTREYFETEKKNNNRRVQRHTNMT